MDESVFSRELVNTINLRHGSAARVIPSRYGMNGLTDIVASIHGKFLGIEAKLVKDLPKRPSSLLLKYSYTKIQELTAKRFCENGKAIVKGLICIRPLKIAVMTDVIEGLNMTYEGVFKYPNLKFLGNGLWDLRDLIDLIDGNGKDHCPTSSSQTI